DRSAWDLSRKESHMRTEAPALLESETYDDWQTSAQELAQWAWERLVARTDRYGSYRSKSQLRIVQQKGTDLSPTLTRQNLTFEDLVKHFKASSRKDLVGTFPVDANNQAKWGAFDFDCHDGSDQTAKANERAATRLHRALTRRKFNPLL